MHSLSDVDPDSELSADQAQTNNHSNINFNNDLPLAQSSQDDFIPLRRMDTLVESDEESLPDQVTVIQRPGNETSQSPPSNNNGDTKK